MTLNSINNIKKIHSQYYTKDTLGDLLVSLIPPDSNCNYIIDLSSGKGALLESASRIFPEATTIGFDVDNNNTDLLQQKTQHLGYTIDSTTLQCLQQARIISKVYCLVIGNPPYKSILNTKYITQLFKKHSYKLVSKTVRAEIVFLLQSIELLRNDGVLAFIVPDGILTNSKFKYVRELICKKMCLLFVKEMPNASFTGTEARTHIIIIKKAQPLKFVKLLSKDKEKPELKISLEQFCERGDYKYHAKPRPINSVKLEDLCLSIRRGKSYFKESLQELPYIHTTIFKEKGLFLVSNFNVSEELSDFMARKDDILLARVGSRVVGKFKVVLKGNYKVSDCIIIIRPRNKHCRDLIIKTLQSETGQSWMHSATKGVGALHITIEEIKKIPIFI